MISFWWVPFSVALGCLLGWMWRGLFADRDEERQYERLTERHRVSMEELRIRHLAIVKRLGDRRSAESHVAEPVPDNGGET